MVQKKDHKFEDAVRRLEEIVEQMESGELDLDASLKLYEEGIVLSQSCSKRLDEAQKKIEVLTRSNAGKLSKENSDKDHLKSSGKKK